MRQYKFANPLSSMPLFGMKIAHETIKLLQGPGDGGSIICGDANTRVAPLYCSSHAFSSRSERKLPSTVDKVRQFGWNGSNFVSRGQLTEMEVVISN